MLLKTRSSSAVLIGVQLLSETKLLAATAYLNCTPDTPLNLKDLNGESVGTWMVEEGSPRYNPGNLTTRMCFVKVEMPG